MKSRIPFSFALCLLATGCANFTDTPAGTPIDTVIKQFGEPTLTCGENAGGYRAIWSQQPLGEYAWATQVDAQGNIGKIDQILDDRFFNQLSEGRWDLERVQCMFGPPADIADVGLPSVRKTAWSYRYRQFDTWYMMMNVFFDPETMVVVDHYPSPDPMFEFADDFRF
jgi:hypothetical protein